MGKEKRLMLLAGAIIGIFSVVLVKFGNPVNMGICVACFIRDVAGALGLHKAEVVQYIRPEISGFILGAFAISLGTGEFRARGGSSPIIRFCFGVFVMIGALVFLGCPLRMILRLANGDLNALIGLFGFLAGIVVGIQFIKKGFSLGKSYKQTMANGYILPVIAVSLIVFMLIRPAFINFSVSGPGSQHAPFAIALAVGLAVGILIQRTRICTVGGFRDIFLLKDFHLFWGLVGIFGFALIGNIIFNPTAFRIGFVEQPIAHNDFLWNFLGMFLVGYASVLLGGCPLRQTILGGEGDTDAAITVLGLLVGAAIAHNFGLAASAKGVPLNGKIAVVIGLLVVTVVAVSNVYNIVSKNKKERAGADV